MTVRELLARFGGAIGFGRRDRELSQERAFHREMLEERHRARGLDPAVGAARRVSRAGRRRADRRDVARPAEPADARHAQAGRALRPPHAVLAHWVPVRRALRIDPASALRAE